MAQTGSPDDQRHGPNDAVAQRERRQQALQQLAAQQRHQAQQTASTSPSRARTAGAASKRPAISLRPPRRRARPANPWIIAVGPALVVIAVVAIVLGRTLLASHRTASGPATATGVRYITPLADGMRCAADVAWSPKADKIAVLGYGRMCRQQDTPFDHSVGLVNIYDVASRKLVNQIHPDDAIVPGIRPNGPNSAVPAGDVSYQGLLWSADETQLAVSFSVFGHLSGLPQPFDALGLFVSDLHGGSTTGLVKAPRGDFGAPTVPEWSVERSSTTYSVDSVTSAMTLPPTLSYAWTDSSFGPRGPRLDTGTPVASAPRGPIGDPDGGAGFTIWQPGIALIRAPDDATTAGGSWAYYTTFGAWSPDGRYVVAPQQFPFTIAQSGAGAPPTAGQSGGSIPPPYAPLRDKGLEAVYAMLATEKTDTASALIAWRPDGAVIAAKRQPTATLTVSTSVVLYDCASGKQLGTLQPATVLKEQMLYAPGSMATDFVQWSPDGTHLLVLAPAAGTLTIFGPGQLPK